MTQLNFQNRTLSCGKNFPLVVVLAIVLLVAWACASGPETPAESPYDVPTLQAPTIDDCISEARFHSDVDSVRLETIKGTDPRELTDRQRVTWYEFFERTDHELMTACMALWSEEITEDNADKRNNQYGSCVDELTRYARGGDLDVKGSRLDALALLNRPYLSLTVAERFVLRESLQSYDYCELYYPQLFFGRWIPFLDER